VALVSVVIPELSVALALTFFTSSAFAQSPAPDLNAPPAATDSDKASGQTASAAAPQTTNERYRDGMVIWETPADASVPFLLKFNIHSNRYVVYEIARGPFFPTLISQAPRTRRCTTRTAC
jgi:hypothetical protein